MSRALIAALLVVASIAAANAFGLGLGNRFGRLGTAPGAGTISPPPTPGGALLLEDGSSILLLEDGASNLCLEGGC